MTYACRRHRSGGGPGARSGIIECCRGEITAIAGTSGHEDLTIREEGGGVDPPCCRHRSCGGPGAHRRIIEFCGGETTAIAATSSGNEDLAIRKEGGGVIIACRRHRSCGGPRSSHCDRSIFCCSRPSTVRYGQIVGSVNSWRNTYRYS